MGRAQAIPDRKRPQRRARPGRPGTGNGQLRDRAKRADTQSPPPGRAQLNAILRTLGGDVLSVLVAPRGLEILVGQSVIVGAGEPVPAQPGGILLVAGSGESFASTIRMIRDAAAAGYSAAVIKAVNREPSGAAAAAERAGLALLIAPDQMDWRHLDAVITAAGSAESDATSYGAVGVGDLFSLANVIASRVGGAVTIEDPRGRLLAYSNLPHQDIDEVRRLAILGRQTPEWPTTPTDYRRVIDAMGPVRVLSGQRGVFPRLAIAVRAGPRLLGLIWALDSKPPLGPDAAAAMEDAARVTALHLLRARSQTDPDRFNRAEALRSLLDGTISPQVAATRLRIPVHTASVVLAFAPSIPDPELGIASARVVDLVGLCCEAWRRNSLCTLSGGTVYALLPDDRKEATLRKFAEDVAATVENSAHIKLHVGIGSGSASLDQIADSRRLADRVLLALAESPGASRVATADEVRSKIVLQKVADGDTALDEVPSPVHAMTEYDRIHRTVYASSVLAFLEALGDASKAAARLHVHENTLRYRIRRVHELFDIDLDEPDARLVIWLELRLGRQPAY
mgnify:CR=1 FL=1